MNFKKLAWHDLARGKMSREVQDAFERAQRTAAERGLGVKIKLEIMVGAPRVDDATYQPVAYALTIAEPAKKSKIYDMVRRNDIAVSDAEEAPEQLDLSMPTHLTPALRLAGNERA
ncbi:MAG: hypothetical protein ABIW76_24565 [Fibrobacteria bacterium]